MTLTVSGDVVPSDRRSMRVLVRVRTGGGSTIPITGDLSGEQESIAEEVAKIGQVMERRISMATYMLVRHKVKDFSEWKRGYDAHQPKRAEAGLKEEYLLRGADDPNEVIVLFKATDLGRAKAFADSTDLRETMQNVGVLEKPDIYFLND
jgi:hypothetical protein